LKNRAVFFGAKLFQGETPRFMRSARPQ
jgi:hypothetical protein